MSLDLMIWLLLFGALLLGVPIFVSLGMATFIALTLSDIPLSIIPLDLYKVSELFPLLAVPAFIFAGALMERGGMAQQIIDVASILVGRFTGGLALATIVGCVFFAAMIGSGPGTTAAMGALMIPSMVRQGYSKDYSAAVCSTGGTLGILIPPSNPMIVYGVIANVSIASLFMAGFIPGFFVGICLMTTSYIIARKRGFKGTDEKYTVSDFFKTCGRNIFALLAPVIILGGIYAGIFTPVEASVVAVVYAFLVGWIINKKLTWKGLWESFNLTNVATGTVLIVVGVSTLFGRFVTMYEVPQRLAKAIMQVSTDPFIVLLMIGGFLFFLGMFMETLATVVIITPVVLPLLKQLGVDPIHFGIILVMTNEIAMLTPPLGVNLFVAMQLSNLSLEKVAKAAFPYILTLIICTIIVMRFPSIVLFLPNLFGSF
ncbi:MAG: C4-dicarboxylate transporter, DctM subunit [Clostridia bacterium]|nr:C4-dicarboxylate transporter, DctM subunit [Clostridia bacterium]